MDLDPYLIFKLTGILSFIIFGSYTGCQAGIPLKKILPVTIFAVIAGYFGSTFWYIVQHLFGSEPYEVKDLGAMMDGAGSVLYGWILGGSLSVYIASKSFKLPTLKLFDLLLPWLLFAQILNRLGCFEGQCCYGSPEDVSWAVWNEFADQKVHPVQLYEAFADLILLAVLWIAIKPGAGQRTFVYFTGYATARFFLEFYRGDNKPALFQLTVPQLTSLAVFFWALLLAAFLRRKKRQ